MHVACVILDISPVFVLGILVIVALLCGLIYLYTAEQNKKQEWHDWASVHCKVTEKREGNSSLDTGVGISTSGKPVVGWISSDTPDQTAYKCDDGVTYWKND